MELRAELDGEPTVTTVQTSTSATNQVGGETGGKGSVLVAEVSGKATFQRNTGSTDTTTETKALGGLVQVVREIAGSEFVLFVDDFHYIPTSLQPDVARQIKAAAEKGVRVCVATVPHRADNVVRNNAELRGRLAQVDTKY